MLYLIGAALLFSVMTLLVKWGGESLTSSMMVFARGVVTTIFGWLWLRRIRQPIWGSRRPLLWLRGAFGLIGLLGFFTALTLLPLAVATILHSINPILTTIFAALFLRERVRWSFGFALTAAFGGVLLVIQPSEIVSGTSLSPIGVGAALVGACGAAAAYVSVRKLRESDHPLVMVFYFSLVTTAGAFPFALQQWAWPVGHQWWVLLAIGIVTQLAQVLLTRGLALVPAGPATSIGYLQVVLAVVWGSLLFQERPETSTLAGAACILLSTAWIAFSKGSPPAKPARSKGSAYLGPRSVQPIPLNCTSMHLQSRAFVLTLKERLEPRRNHSEPDHSWENDRIKSKPSLRFGAIKPTSTEHQTMHFT